MKKYVIEVLDKNKPKYITSFYHHLSDKLFWNLVEVKNKATFYDSRDEAANNLKYLRSNLSFSSTYKLDFKLLDNAKIVGFLTK